MSIAWIPGPRPLLRLLVVVAVAVLAACGDDGPTAGPDQAGALLADLDADDVVVERSDFREFRAEDDPPEVTLSLTAEGELTVWDEDLGRSVVTTLPESEVLDALVAIWDGSPGATDFLDDNEFVQHCIETFAYLDPTGERVAIDWDCGSTPEALAGVLEIVDGLRGAGAS